MKNIKNLMTLIFLIIGFSCIFLVVYNNQDPVILDYKLRILKKGSIFEHPQRPPYNGIFKPWLDANTFSTQDIEKFKRNHRNIYVFSWIYSDTTDRMDSKAHQSHTWDTNKIKGYLQNGNCKQDTSIIEIKLKLHE
jgi:hypothetical protein